MEMMMTNFASVVLAFMVVFWTRSLQADVIPTTLDTMPSLDAPITYTERAIASGTLGGSTFTNALITIMLDGDTGNVTEHGTGVFANTGGTFTVNVSSIGTATFTDSMVVFDNQVYTQPLPVAGFGLLAGGSVLDTFNTVFGLYDLTTPIGPVSGESFFVDLVVGTTLGDLHITRAGDSTFTASTVPESSSLIPLGALGAILAYRLRRKPANS
jgi:hypothetical protein